jgi:ribose 5-phosphate isomerase B
MKIAIGSDHAGYPLKQHLVKALEAQGHLVLDKGTHSEESCDYPDFGDAVAREVAGGAAERGIVVCTTGIGMSITANKVRGIRAALASSVDAARLTRLHNDANVLAIAAKYTEPAAAEALVETFLGTAFEGGRHGRRVAKITAVETRESAASESK